MLNMKAQTQWAQQMYGGQSDRIRAYTELHLVERMDDPRMVELRRWVDPYSYRARYKLPKLLLLGTNDPYWVVDSLRQYWDELPEPKLVFQTPERRPRPRGRPRGHAGRSPLSSRWWPTASRCRG